MSSVPPNVPSPPARFEARPVTVHALAMIKRLPMSYLQQLGLHDLASDGVGIPYYDELNEPIAVKRRTKLCASQGSFWPARQPVCAYGQWKIEEPRKQGFVILVEGESDCWTLWHHGVPALGLPGSSTARTLTRELLVGLAKVYIHVEPDQGGQTFRTQVLHRLGELDFDGDILALRMPDGIKDPSDLHISSPEQFSARFQQALADAVPEAIPEQVTTTPLRPAKPTSLSANGRRGEILDDEEERAYEPKTTNLAVVQPQRVRFLWEGRIPLGKLTILDGDPGLGKSSVTLDIAARVTRGLPMPGAAVTSALPPGNVVLLTEEDGLEDTIRPRLEAAGADLTRVEAFEGMHTRGGKLRPLGFPYDAEWLEKVVLAHEARLVIIDPLMVYLDQSINANNDQNVRRALLPIAQLAEKSGAAIVVVRHLNKQPGKNVLYRGGGSIGIIGAARSGLIVCKDPDAPEQRLLGVSKCNLCKPPRALRYELVDALACAKVQWLEETDHDLGELIAGAEDGSEPLSDEEEFLRARLPLSTAPLFEEAAGLGLSQSSLRRAKKKLGIISRFVAAPDGNGGHWLWEFKDAPQDQAG